jgi:N utilization substance protein B
MKHSRHQARIVALQGLYELDMQRDVPAEDIPAMVTPLFKEAGLPGESADYARQLVAGAWADHDRYDRMIGEASDHWDVSRMAVVDRNILRLGLYELIERPDVPARVVIDEAIELGRTFGTAETPQFINGVLDAIWKRDPACQTARAAREAMVRPAGGGLDRG